MHKNVYVSSDFSVLIKLCPFENSVTICIPLFLARLQSGWAFSYI